MADLEPADRDDERAAALAAKTLGSPDVDGRVIRRGVVTSVRLRSCFARVHRGSDNTSATREVRIGRLLEAADVPAARLLPGPQPLLTDGASVTVWAIVERVRPTRLGDLGALARLLHETHG